MTRGLDVLHTPRDLERVLQRQWKQAERQLDPASQAEATVARDNRQGRAPRGVSGVAGRAWHKAERLVEQAVNAQEAVQQIAAALSWVDAQGRLACRHTAQAQLDEASQRLQGGIDLTRDSVASVRYAEGLNSSKSSVPLQSTDRHDILGQKSAGFQRSL
jgi:hypothetical protein